VAAVVGIGVLGSVLRLDVLEALLLVVWDTSLEENGVRPVLGVQQRRIAEHPAKEVDALMPLLEVSIVLAERNRTAGAAERPPGGYFNWWFPRYMGYKEVHSNVFAVHVLIHFIPNRLR